MSTANKTRTIDARGLVPPEPFEKVVEALTTLEDGETLLLLLEREPMPLYQFLQNNRYSWKTSAQPGGHFEINIWEN